MVFTVQKFPPSRVAVRKHAQSGVISAETPSAAGSGGTLMPESLDAGRGQLICDKLHG